jgi:hypothetical protein
MQCTLYRCLHNHLAQRDNKECPKCQAQTAARTMHTPRRGGARAARDTPPPSSAARPPTADIVVVHQQQSSSQSSSVVHSSATTTTDNPTIRDVFVGRAPSTSISLDDLQPAAQVPSRTPTPAEQLADELRALQLAMASSAHSTLTRQTHVAQSSGASTPSHRRTVIIADGRPSADRRLLCEAERDGRDFETESAHLLQMTNDTAATELQQLGVNVSSATDV